MKIYKKREIVAIDEMTGERRDFSSINAAAAFLGTNFSNVQRAAMSNGICNGWRLYESARTIKEHIKELQAQLKVLER